MISLSQISPGKIHTTMPLNVILFRKICLPWLMLMVMVGSCKQGTEIQQESLYGKWDIIRAMRNGRETPYLRGGYFIFENNGSMIVNITGVDEKSPFTLERNTIHANPSKDFVIESIQSDSMTIRYAKGQDSEFLFYLSKHVADPR